MSQFTLYAQLNGNKPNFHLAMKTAQSKEFYGTFLKALGTGYHEDKIKDGVFGAMMEVNITNEGPVTLELDSRKFNYVQDKPTSETSEQ